jgi:hypothetical protein
MQGDSYPLMVSLTTPHSKGRGSGAGSNYSGNHSPFQSQGLGPGGGGLSGTATSPCICTKCKTSDHSHGQFIYCGRGSLLAHALAWKTMDTHSARGTIGQHRRWSTQVFVCRAASDNAIRTPKTYGIIPLYPRGMK